MASPKVSVIIPTYNHQRYLTLAVTSVLRQSYKDLEILVIDDGSTDQTGSALRPYRDHIRYFYKKNGGTASALNLGLAQAQGTYIAWLSADDLFLQEKVMKQVERMDANPQWGFSYTSFVVIDGRGVKRYEVNSLYYPDKREMVLGLVKGCFINGSSVMMRRTALDDTGGFDEKLLQAHDYDLWLRLLRKHDCGFLPERLLAYRWHGRNMSRNSDEKWVRIVRERAKELFPEWLKGSECSGNGRS